MYNNEVNILNKYIFLIVCLMMVLFLPWHPLAAQNETQSKKTSVSGVVVDAETGETLPFVQIYFVETKSNKSDATATQYGAMSDTDGNFSVSNPSGYTTLYFQMIGYKTETYTARRGQDKKNIKIKMKPDVYGLQDVVVTPKNGKKKYRRKGNPAVELIRNVIAHKDSFQVKSTDHYTAETYHRMSFAIDNFTPDFHKGLWKHIAFIEKYIDTTGVYPSLNVSIRENSGHEYYVRKPRREKKVIERKRIFGLESLLSTQSLESAMTAVFSDVDIYDDNMNLLFNRFVSPVSNGLAVSYYQYYIMDTIQLNGDSVIDLAFVPVNSESYSFTGHLYIMKDSTYKIKKYSINIPQHINMNFVSHYSVEHEYAQLANGLWAPSRTNTSCKFYLTNRNRTLLARQTKIYTGFDFDSAIDPEVFSSRVPVDTVKHDSTSISADFRYWDEHRPEPLSRYEGSVFDMVNELKATPKFNGLIMTIDAIMSEYVQTVPSSRFGDSKWDFGPIYNTVSWNKLEGVRMRIGGQTTANLHPKCFFSGYVAFGTTDLRPKYNAMVMYSFNKKRYHLYEGPQHYLSLTCQYDAEQPGLQTGIIDRDNILMSIPTGTVVDKNMQYAFHTKLQYSKEFPNHLAVNTSLRYEYNEAAGAMHYDRLVWQDEQNYTTLPLQNNYHQNAYHNYECSAELRYMPGTHAMFNRMGVETPFTLDHDAPVFSLTHQIGYLDDRLLADTNGKGGQGFFYNRTEMMAEKRFWFSSFGHLDARLQAGYVWQKVPFTKLFYPQTNTSILLGKNAFNLMQPMEFMFDAYVSLYATYFFKGWILNRIPGINKLKLRGVVSFSIIYGALTKQNNPYYIGSEGLYALPNNQAVWTFDKNDPTIVTAGATSSPIGKLPYMELTAGFENIFKFIRIDYVRRLTYNDYELPVMMQNANGEMVHARRRYGGWGRNGVKLTVRISL